MKPKLLVSFSGGKTSAMMSYLIKTRLAEQYDLVFIFANTGQENEETLQFVKNCDEYFELGVVWVEAAVNPEHGKGTKHKVVSFETACRDGSLFMAMSQKYGIPNLDYPHCTRELKTKPIRSYAKSIGWKTGEYKTAIGIRTDEASRAAKDGGEYNCIYPLIGWWPSDKEDVSIFWEDQQFQLGLKEHQGNCKWCWKKSKKKHYRIIKDNPEFFNTPFILENSCSKYGAEFRRDPEHAERRLFRGYKTTTELFKEAELISIESLQFFDDDDERGCGQSCEPFGTTENESTNS